MLVLSRRAGERIVLPGMGVTISVEQVLGERVVLGFEAPRAIPILRSELSANLFHEPIAATGRREPHKECEMPLITILLAARPSLSRKEYHAALIRQGFQVQLADDGERCKRILQESLPNVLVLEAELPQGGGDGVLEVMHERLQAQCVPVFVLTTEQSRSAMYRISRFEISNFAVGPMVADQLADRVACLATQKPRVSA